MEKVVAWRTILALLSKGFLKRLSSLKTAGRSCKAEYSQTSQPILENTHCETLSRRQTYIA
jgi:hypothetical protein